MTLIHNFILISFFRFTGCRRRQEAVLAAAFHGVRPVRVPGGLDGGDDGGRDEEEGLRQRPPHLREAARAQGRQGRPHGKVFQVRVIAFMGGE